MRSRGGEAGGTEGLKEPGDCGKRRDKEKKRVKNHQAGLPPPTNAES
jgi:hypothetical protein